MEKVFIPNAGDSCPKGSHLLTIPLRIVHQDIQATNGELRDTLVNTTYRFSPIDIQLECLDAFLFCQTFHLDPGSRYGKHLVSWSG